MASVLHGLDRQLQRRLRGEGGLRPYHANDRTCKDDDNCNYADSRLTGFYNKWHTTEAEMKELVYIAPVATTVYASYFGDYGGGIFDDNRCCEAVSDPDCIWTLNHE